MIYGMSNQVSHYTASKLLRFRSRLPSSKILELLHANRGIRIENYSK